MTSSDNDVQSERGEPQKKGMFGLQSQDAFLAQNKIMTQQLESLMKKLSQLPKELQNVSQAQHQPFVQGCELCGGDHQNGQCVVQSTTKEGANYMGNQSRQGNYGNYNQGWRPHPSMEQAKPSNRPPNQQQPSLLEETLHQFMEMSMSNEKSTKFSLRNLEVQTGQLAKKLEDKPDNTFGPNTEPNPKEHCKAITTRSGKVLDGVVVRKKSEKDVIVEEE
ncbi:hypothetical protein VIGAN_01152800, partial [Vigna angularis var. angularis]